jgi:hypothetical protein
MMKNPVILVIVVLTVATLLAASLVIATETRGENGGAMFARGRPLSLVQRAL